MARYATEHNRCNFECHGDSASVLLYFTFENSKRDWRVPDATDMLYHAKYEKGLPLRDVYINVSSSYCINLDQENKNIESHSVNMDTEIFESGWDWCYARGEYTLGLHEI